MDDAARGPFVIVGKLIERLELATVGCRREAEPFGAPVGEEVRPVLAIYALWTLPGRRPSRARVVCVFTRGGVNFWGLGVFIRGGVCVHIVRRLRWTSGGQTLPFSLLGLSLAIPSAPFFGRGILRLLGFHVGYGGDQIFAGYASGHKMTDSSGDNAHARLPHPQTRPPQRKQGP